MSNTPDALTREQHERQMDGIKARARAARRSTSLGALAGPIVATTTVDGRTSP